VPPNKENVFIKKTAFVNISLAMCESEKESNDAEVQVKLSTRLDKYKVPDTTLSVPASILPADLDTLVHGLLSEAAGDPTSVVEFEWLCCGELVRGPLGDHLKGKSDITAETVILVEYVEKSKPPQPEASVNHDDWVSACRVSGDLILTGCYDNTINIWTVGGHKKLVIPGHNGPVKSVAWISHDETGATFVSTSHDQTANIWTWDSETNSIESVNTCRGHERSVECVAVAKKQKQFATGSFDNTLKIWGASVQKEELNEGEKEVKRARGSQGKALTRTPLQTLGGHKESVSAVAWLGNQELASASWDHTIKIWDTELGGLKTELVGNKAFFSMSFSPLSGAILASGADRNVRLYDQRSTEGSVVKAMFTSHVGWVTAVAWSEVNEHHFASGSHDSIVKMWDTRSFKTPLFDLKGHTDKVMCCDWSTVDWVVSGGADNDMKIFGTNLKT